MSAKWVLNINTQIVASQIFDSEAVIINLGNGMIYTMDGVGAEVWRMIGQGRSIQFISEDLAANYSVTVEQAVADIDHIARELLAEELVVVEEGSPASGPEVIRVERRKSPAPYRKPKLVKDSDMRDVLALDPPLPRLDASGASLKVR